MFGKTRKAKAKANKMRGGKFKGKGAYGCAFNPPLKCRREATRRNGRQLSKLLYRRSADKEYQESVPFRRIDPERKFFIWTDTECSLNQSNIKPENEITKCPKEVVDYRSPEATLLFYEMGGSDLSKIQLEAADYAPFIVSLGNLLEGLAIIHANGIAHCDIKPDNIVSKRLEDNTFATRFIDFGLAENTTRISSASSKIMLLSKHPYPYYPFEIKYLWAMRERGTTEQEIGKWYSTIGSDKYLFPQSVYWNKDWTQKYHAADFEALRSQIAFPRETRKGLEGVDVFGLGVSLTMVYSRLTGHYMRGPREMPYIAVAIGNREVPVRSLTAATFNGDEEIVNWHRQVAKFISIPFYSIVIDMLYINPINRFTAKKAYETFERLVIPNVERVLSNPAITEKSLKAIGIHLLSSTRTLTRTLASRAPITGAPPMPTRAPTTKRSNASLGTEALRGPAPPPPPPPTETSKNIAVDNIDQITGIVKDYRKAAMFFSNNDPRKQDILLKADRLEKLAFTKTRDALVTRLSQVTNPIIRSQIEQTIQMLDAQLSA